MMQRYDFPLALPTGQGVLSLPGIAGGLDYPILFCVL